jgi:hypothetical protein
MAAEQARAVHATLLSGLGRWVSGIETAVTVFSAAAHELAELAEVLRRYDTTAAEHGYMITDDGTVAIGEDSRTDTTAGRDEDEEDVVRLRAGVASVLQRAAHIDTRLRTGLHAAPSLPHARVLLPSDNAARAIARWPRGPIPPAPWGYGWPRVLR